ncbi:hypothetical protein JRQ81_014174 [Phrynocephalus forsythii]|uniref:Fat storage-inducing transmembrane protein 2 n=1 Tax=Phrynocephalus forsythii TaxID=171643 RepID=A0A9Q1B375_9SAUR|nr:hypothetical protein JRQ81_014174 [Phrynocephalus forsythii]
MRAASTGAAAFPPPPLQRLSEKCACALRKGGGALASRGGWYRVTQYSGRELRGAEDAGLLSPSGQRRRGLAREKSGMEYADRSAHFLLPYLGNSAVRRLMPWGLLLLMLGGSFIKEWSPVPESYMSNKRNLLNIYFVKFAWAWTLFLLLPFISITHYLLTRNLVVVAQRLSTLLAGTAIWYACTGVFLHIEDLTGSCYSSSNLDVLLKEHPSRLQCQQAHGFWHGFDISGHCFLLSYCVLMIVEEITVMHSLNTSRNPRLQGIVSILFLALSVLIFIWVWMFFTTAIYFHNLSQKVFGTLMGLLAWYGTYRFWYLKPFSPGLPPQRTNLSAQKSNHSL